MRNYLTLVIGLVIVTAPAFASRARLESLGESKNGSIFINDINNMYYNPAFVNDFKKKLQLEFGTAANNAADAVGTATAKPQALYTNSFGDFGYALGLGHVDDRIVNTIDAVDGLATAGSYLFPDNALQFFFGGDMGVKWGVSASWAGNYAKGRQPANFNTEQAANFWGLNAGVVAGALQVYVDAMIIGKTTGNVTSQLQTDEIKGDVGLDVGAAYTFMDNFTGFAKYATAGATRKTGATPADDWKIKSTTMELGLGYKKDVTKSVNLFSRVEAAMSTLEIKAQPAGTVASSTKSWNMPLTIGAEAQALSWLAVRGSVAQSLLGNVSSSTGIVANTNSTTVSSGVGMTFGDLTIDGLVATTGANGSTAVGTGGSKTATNSNFGFGDNMISRISLGYNF